MAFGEILQELRKDKGLTQAELAKQLGLVASTIGNYENGIAEPSFSSLRKLSVIFNVSVDFLLELTKVRCSWNDLRLDFTIKNGSVPINAIIESLKSMDINYRTTVLEVMNSYHRLDQYEKEAASHK